MCQRDNNSTNDHVSVVLCLWCEAWFTEPFLQIHVTNYAYDSYFPFVLYILWTVLISMKIYKQRKYDNHKIHQKSSRRTKLKDEFVEN